MTHDNSDSAVRYCTVALAGGLALLLGAPAFADTTDDLLDKLRQKGILSQEEFLALKQRKTIEERQAPAAQAVPPSSPSATRANPALAPSTPFVTMMDKGIGLHLGAVDLTFSGNINAFYVQDWPDKATPSTTVAGGLANTGGTNTASVRNGLLPGNFSINLKTKQEGYDIGVTFGFYPGLNSVSGVGGANSPGNNHALGTTGIDFRQQFVTIGTEHMGTFKAGRDIGLFAQEAILNDFTLFGVGSPGGNLAPSNTTLGRIGLGYIYTDWIPQITYTSPTFAGWQAAAGVFTPLGAANFSGVSGTLSASDEPQIQAKLTYTVPDGTFGPVGAKFWANAVTEDLKSNGGTDARPAGSSQRALGGDFGAKLTLGGAALMLYGYLGDGIGTTGLYFDAVSPTGATRSSYGYIGQLTYTFLERLTVGGSYGLSHLSLASGEVNPLLVKDNESTSFGVRYKLTDWVNLVTEYTHTHSRAQGGNAASEDTVAAGTIVFF
jgi:predicted porin